MKTSLTSLPNPASFIALLLLVCLSGLPAQDYSNYEWTIYDTTNTELLSDHITDVLVISENTAWVATSGLDLYYFENGNFRRIPDPEFPVRNWFMQLEWWDEDQILICGMADKLVLFNTITETYEEIPFVGQVTNMERNHLGNFLFGMHPGNFFPLHQRFQRDWQGLGKYRQDVMGIYIADNGDAYVSYRDGLYFYHMQEDGSYADSGDKLSDLAFYELAHDSMGVLWAASFTELKLHSYQNGRWTTYQTGPEELYYDFRGEPQYTIRSLLILPDDRVVISCQFVPGIAVFDGETWESYKLPTDEFDGVYRIKRGPDGSIWCPTATHGLGIFHPKK